MTWPRDDTASMAHRLNLGVKYRCTDSGSARRTLEALGAQHSSTEHQADHFFNVADSNAILKVRITSENIVAFYYTPAQDREDASFERWTLAGDAGNLLAMLCAVMPVRATVVKTREYWNLGDWTFHLDKVEQVGDIFELETPVDADKQRIIDVLTSLDAYLGEKLYESNVDLVLQATRGH